MKKFCLSLAMALCCAGAFAQHAVGTVSIQPKVGLNIANLTNSEGDPRFGVAAGAELEYQISDIFSLSGGVLYSMQGAKDSDSGISSTMKVDYINIPIMANVYVLKNFAVKVGIQPGFNVNSEISASEDNVSGSVDFGDYTNTVDFSIPVGLSYEYRNFVLDARYNFGVTNVFKQDKLKDFIEQASEGEFEYNDEKVRNSVFQITLGYKFDL